MDQHHGQLTSLVTHYLFQGLDSQAMEWLDAYNARYLFQGKTAALGGDVLPLEPLVPRPPATNRGPFRAPLLDLRSRYPLPSGYPTAEGTTPMLHYCQCAHDHPGRRLRVTEGRLCEFCRWLHPAGPESQRPRREGT